jgi:heme/copper-type cytochrome/quinol oxidase subunit 2
MAFVPPPIHPGGNDSDSVDIPTSWVIGYMVVALIVWIIVAVAVVLYEAATERLGPGPVQPTGDQMIEGLVLGATAGIVWPLAIVAGGIWLLVRHLTRTQPTTTPED